jgi:hypothetical protein
MRTACVIAVSRARDMFEPFVHQARHLHTTLTPGNTGTRLQRLHVLDCAAAA